MASDISLAAASFSPRPAAQNLLSRNPQFSRIWLAGLLSQTGSGVSRMALLLWLAGQYGVPMASALILCETLPGAVVSVATGAIADRFDKKWLMVGGDMLRLLALVGAIRWPAPGPIFGMMCFYSVANAVFQPARSAATPMVVDAKDLARANSLDQGASTAVLIAGPYAGALLLYSAGLRTTLAIDAATFLLSALLLLPVRVPRAPRFATQRVISDICLGWTYLWRHPVALDVALLVEFSVLCVSLWTPLAAAFVKTFLHADPTLVGLQMALFGAGGIVGSFVAPRAMARWGKGKLLTGLLVTEAGLMLLYTMLPSVAASSGVIVLWGAVVTVMMVPYYCLIQETVAPEYLGRVFALSRQFENLASVLGMAAAVGLNALLNPRLSLVAAAAVYLTCSSVYRLSRRGRRLALIS
jgi:DHA3 family macrolide efflux protein-like MFS transporter